MATGFVWEAAACSVAAVAAVDFLGVVCLLALVTPAVPGLSAARAVAGPSEVPARRSRSSRRFFNFLPIDQTVTCQLRRARLVEDGREEDEESAGV
jgi:hypothetical protein